MQTEGIGGLARHRWSPGTDGARAQTEPRYRRHPGTDGARVQTDAGLQRTAIHSHRNQWLLESLQKGLWGDFAGTGGGFRDRRAL